MKRTRFLTIANLSVIVAGLFQMSANAETVVVTVPASDPTAEIDRYLTQRWEELGIATAERCTDRQFVRRAFLDLAGRVPTPAEIEVFLDDTSDDRRDRLIDQLLKSEDYVQHFTDLFDALLMGRAGEDKYAARKNHHWRAYLESVLRDNRPWNDVVSEILLRAPRQTQRGGGLVPVRTQQ